MIEGWRGREENTRRAYRFTVAAVKRHARAGQIKRETARAEWDLLDPEEN